MNYLIKIFYLVGLLIFPQIVFAKNLTCNPQTTKICDIKSCKTPVQASYSKLRGGKNDIDSNSFIGIVETELLPELKMSGYEKVTGPRWQIHMGHPMLMYTLHSSVERKKYKIVSVALANDALYRVDVASFDETASKNAHAEFLAAVDYSDR